MAARARVVGGQVVVAFEESEAGVSPGQACVFYRSGEPGARVLGGGWIERVQNALDKRPGLGVLESEFRMGIATV
jgi:tRNA-specific 2-thiouridylase